MRHTTRAAVADPEGAVPAHRHEQVDTRRLPIAGILGLPLAAGADLAIRVAGRRSLHVPAHDQLLSVLAIGVTDAAAVLWATLGLAALARTQSRPITAFRTLAGAVLPVSRAGPLVARAGCIAGVQPVTTHTMTAMLLMHVATVLVIVAVLTTMPRSPSASGTDGRQRPKRPHRPLL